MANNSPTIVAASLSDDQLKKSIDSLVTHVDEAMKKMVQSTNNAVGEMEAKLKSLGNLKIDSGGSTDGGSSRRTSSVEKETKARKELSMTLDQQASAINTAVQSEKKYTEEIRKQAAAIRATKEWQEKGWVMIGDNRFFDRDRANATKRERENMLTLEERLIQLQQQEAQAALVAAEAKRQQAQATKEAAQARKDIEQHGFANITNYRGVVYAENDERAKGLTIEQQIEKIIQEENAARNAQLGTERQITQEVEQRGKKYVSPNTEINTAFNRMVANKIGLSEQDINTTSTKISTLTQYIKQLEQAWSKMTDAERNSPFGKMLRQELQYTTRLVQQARKELTRPINLKDALSGSEKTLDDIANKIQRLQSYKRGLDLTDPKQVAELNQIDAAINRLNGDLNKYMGTTKQATEMNKVLGRSWNYMKNRLAFYFTVGASTAFVKNLIEVRSQYEMNERALGILIDSAERGSKIFQELSQMALVSPYTLIELSAAAKQLTAYDVAAKDVVDTTRRLADMASAVGIPVERLTYALGQIKAYGYLNSRDARMFANAGIPLVKQLADYYTQLEGRLVSTADVYDRMKKKAIDYSDVMQVINKMTDEGGKFFDFQAKMADTLKVQLANLTLAWNNMLNEIGAANQGILSGGIKMLKEVFIHWKEINKVLNDVAIVAGSLVAANMLVTVAFGKSTAAAIRRSIVMGSMSAADKQVILASKNLTASEAKLLIALNKGDIALRAQIVNMKLLSVEEANAAANAGRLQRIGYGLKAGFNAAGVAVKSFVEALAAIAPQMLIMAGIMSIFEIVQNINSASEATKDLNKQIADNAKESAKSIQDTINQLNNSGITKDNVLGKTVEEQKKAWETIRGEIELSSASAERFISILLKETNIGERVQDGLKVLEIIEYAHKTMALWHDDAINVSDDFKVLGIGADGLSEDLADFVKYMNKSDDAMKVLTEDADGLEGAWRQVLAWVYDYSDIMSSSGLGTLHPVGWLKNIGDATGLDFLSSGKAKLVDAYKEVQSEIEKTYESLYEQLEQDEVKNADAVYEIISKTISNIAQEKNWSEQQTVTARLLLEQRFADSENAIFRQSVADKRTAWNEWMKFLTTRHKSEFTAMGNEEITTESWAQDKRRKLYEDTFEKFKEYNALAYEQLKDKVNDANQLAIHIKVYYDEQNQPSWLEKDFKNRLPNSTLNVKEYKSVTDLISGEQKALKDANEEIKRLRNAGVSELDEHFLDVKNRARQATEALDAYNAEHEKETKGKSGGGSKKDQLLDALKQEISLVEKLQGDYDKLTKSGASQAEALETIRGAYGKTIRLLNVQLGKYGLPQLDISQLITSKDPNKALAHFKQTLNTLVSKGLLTLERSKELEAVVEKLTLSAKTYNLDKITKGLNNELGKLKDEYELAVELDANPELGDMFADMFGINTSTLPKTFGDALDRAQIIINRKLAEMNITTPFDLMDGNIDSFAKSTGLDKESAVIKELVSVQNTWRDMFKKNITETEKILDDYIKKYGDYSDRIAEIEAGRLEKLKKLNEAYYTEEMRKRPEYIAKLNAIEQGASKEKQQVDFDEFKNSRYYTMMFENLDYISTKTIRDMRDRVRELIDTMNDLTPEQLKTLMSQYEKLEQKLVKRSPFKTLTKDLKEYFATTKERKAANIEFKNAQKEYDAQKKNVAALKEKYEQAKANSNTSQSYLDFLQIEINSEDEILKILKQQLDAAQKKADKYNLIKKLALEELSQTATMVAANLKGLAELRDQMNELFGVDASKGETLLGHQIDGLIDGLSKASDGISKITSSAQSGNVFGVVGGVVDVFTGIGDGIASIFGDGAARTKRINKEINKSKETVRKLSMAYEDLERAVSKSLGTAETEARRAAIANKELQLSELERQKTLEESKRSKDRDDDAIKQYEETIHSLRNEISDLKEDVVNNLWGEDVKSAAEAFVDAWVQAWRAGETTLDAIQEKMDEMIYNLIKKAMTSKIVETLLNPIYKELDRMTKEGSEGGVALTTNELRLLAQQAGITAGEINTALGEFYGNLEQLGIVSKTEDKSSELSALQQGLQSMSESTANALEAYANSISQQVYYHSSLLEQIRDSVVGLDLDVSLGVQSQMLLQLQNSYQTQQAIQQILEGVLVPSGRAFAVELMS